MAYDPFRGAAASSYSNNDGTYRYGDVGSRQPQEYGGGEYDPYDATYPPQQHATTYQQPMYDMDPSMDQSMDMGNAPTFRASGGNGAPKDEFDPFAPPPKSTGDLRMWRQDHRGHLWNKGSRPRCIGRFFCCSLMIIVLLVVSILLTLAIFLRPPDVVFNGLAPIDPSTIHSSSDSLNVSLGLDISVRNPNFFTVSLKDIKAKLTYPIGSTQTAIGGGEEDHISFHSDAQTSFTFPLTLGYSSAVDPQGTVLQNIAQKCGFIPGTAQSDLEIDYTVTIGISVVGITVSPDFSGSASFACPFSESDIKPLVAAFPALQGLLPP